jgi:excinuclease ABC subunit A
LLVDHDPQVLSHADWIVELGPGAGASGGRLIAEGTVADIVANPKSQIGPFLGGCSSTGLTGFTGLPKHPNPVNPVNPVKKNGRITLSTSAIHTVQPLEVAFPKGKLSVVTGVSGSGKTTLILESLVPGLAAQIAGQRLPAHVRSVSAPDIAQVKLIDATPIGINIRSTVATYANVHDELRKIYARTSDAREHGYKAGDFSYNTGSLRCATCDGTGEISLDVQFLPDVDIPCPDCHGSRYGRAAYAVKRKGVAIPELMALSVDEALDACADLRLVKERLQVLHDLGRGYLTLC